MNKNYKKYLENFLSVVKYLLAGLMILAGIMTAFGPLTPMDGALGFLYSTRASLVMFGIVFFLCGATLLYGKIKRNKKLVGIGLMSIYMCFLFAGLLNAIAGAPWIPNLAFSIVVGALYLRWKYTRSYVNPNHFIEHKR